MRFDTVSYVRSCNVYDWNFRRVHDGIQYPHDISFFVCLHEVSGGARREEGEVEEGETNGEKTEHHSKLQQLFRNKNV